MRRAFVTSTALCASACTQQPQPSDQVHAKSSLPQSFTLKCAPPKGSEIPDGANGGFNVSVDRATSKFSFPWDAKPLPIKEITNDTIVFANERGDNGPDGNPYDRQIVFNLKTSVLEFRDHYDGYVPVRQTFSASCKIENNA